MPEMPPTFCAMITPTTKPAATPIPIFASAPPSDSPSSRYRNGAMQSLWRRLYRKGSFPGEYARVEARRRPPTASRSPIRNPAMTSPEPSRPERGFAGRAVIWLIAAALLLVGLYLYFRFGRETPAIIHGIHS